MTKHTILFLAANPSDTDRLALDSEARAIQIERTGHRELKPIVVHFIKNELVEPSTNHSA